MTHGSAKIVMLMLEITGMERMHKTVSALSHSILAPPLLFEHQTAPPKLTKNGFVDLLEKATRFVPPPLTSLSGVRSSRTITPNAYMSMYVTFLCVIV